MEKIEKNSVPRYVNTDTEYVDESKLMSPEEKGQFKALKIMEDVRLAIERQGFMVDKKLHYDKKFHSTLHNGLGTTMEILVGYGEAGIEVELDLGSNNKNLTDQDIERSKQGYSEVFEGIQNKVNSKFGPTAFTLKLYENFRKAHIPDPSHMS